MTIYSVPGYEQLTIVSARERVSDLHLLCEAAERDPKNKAKRNYSTDWMDHNHTLLWQFYNGVYKSVLGEYFLLYSLDNLIGGAGYYKYDDKYVVGMSRFYVMPGSERQWIGRHILHRQLLRARGLAPEMLISFNGYNKRIYDIYVNSKHKLPPIWHAFEPIGLRTINFVEQYCCVTNIEQYCQESDA